MNINWDKIKEECPKSYSKFIEFLEFNCIEVLEKKILCEHINTVEFLKHNICFCDIVKFFDDNNYNRL